MLMAFLTPNIKNKTFYPKLNDVVWSNQTTMGTTFSQISQEILLDTLNLTVYTYIVVVVVVVVVVYSGIMGNMHNTPHT